MISLFLSEFHKILRLKLSKDWSWETPISYFKTTQYTKKVFKSKNTLRALLSFAPLREILKNIKKLNIIFIKKNFKLIRNFLIQIKIKEILLQFNR